MNFNEHLLAANQHLIAALIQARGDELQTTPAQQNQICFVLERLIAAPLQEYHLQLITAGIVKSAAGISKG